MSAGLGFAEGWGPSLGPWMAEESTGAGACWGTHRGLLVCGGAGIWGVCARVRGAHARARPGRYEKLRGRYCSKMHRVCVFEVNGGATGVSSSAWVLRRCVYVYVAGRVWKGVGGCIGVSGDVMSCSGGKRWGRRESLWVSG